MAQNDRVLLGIDGGGTKTVAWLAVASGAGEPKVIGRGAGGSSNAQTVGFAAMQENLDRAINAAFENAGLVPDTAAAAVVALAGSDREENRRVLNQWADGRRLAQRLRIVHDAFPVLAAGTPEGWGVALISGTGSFAFAKSVCGAGVPPAKDCGAGVPPAQDAMKETRQAGRPHHKRDGEPMVRSARAGGWGYLFGDEGSAYWIAVSGLRAAAQAADGRAPSTWLLEGFLDRLQLSKPAELVGAIYRIAGDRAAVAALAEVVFQVANTGDRTAFRILDEAAQELAAIVAAAARKVLLADQPFPLALAGGTLLGSRRLRDSLISELHGLGLQPEPIAEVPEPVAGAIRMARWEMEASR